MRFPTTYCSQCGAEFGPGDAGFSHCKDHTPTMKPYDPADMARQELAEAAREARAKGTHLDSYMELKVNDMTREELLDLVAVCGRQIKALREDSSRNFQTLRNIREAART